MNKTKIFIRSRQMRKAIVFCFVLIIGLWLSVAIVNIVEASVYSPYLLQDDKETRVLAPGPGFGRELSGGQSHGYKVTLAANQYLKIVVEQKGIDVVAEIYLPDGKKLLEVDSPNGIQGPEIVELIATASGDYLLKVRSLEEKAASGRYDVKIVELKIATEIDKGRMAAQRASQEAEQLKTKRTAEALRNAISKYEEALAQWRAIGDKENEAKTLSDVATVHNILGDTQKAIDCNTQALNIRRAIKDRAGEAVSLNNLGVDYFHRQDTAKALELYTQALQINKDLKRRLDEAAVLNNIADVYRMKGEKQKAIDSFIQALSIWRETGDKKSEARTLGNIASMYVVAGDYAKARESFTEALQLSRAVGDHQAEIITMAYLGDVLSLLGDKRQALDQYKQVLNRARESGIRGLEASMLSAIGSVYQDTGEMRQSMNHYNQALKLHTELGNKRGAAVTLNNLGALNFDIGEMQKALDHYEQALKIRREIKDVLGEAETLNNMGVAHQELLGDNEKALEYYKQALPLFRAVGYARGEANLFNSFGVAYKALQDFDKALESYEQAMQLWQKLNDRRGQSLTLRNIGLVYNLDLNQPQKALAYYNQALPLARETSDREGEANCLLRMGLAYMVLNENEKAFENLAQALKIEEEIYNRRAEAETRFALSRAEFKRGNLETALKHAEITLNIVESIRSGLASSKHRSSFFATVQDYYRWQMELLMKMHQQKPNEGWDAKALQLSERARARGLLELLMEARADIRQSVDANLLAEESELQQRITALTNRRIRLLNARHTQEQVERINGEIKELTAEYEKVEAQIRATSPRYAALVQPQPLTLAEIQKKGLDHETVLLEYALGDEQSFLWVVTQNALYSYELPKRETIETSARAFYKAISSRPTNAKTNKEYISAAATLSDMLLKPAAAHLQRGKRLLIVGDRILQYIPFAALPIPSSKFGVLSSKSKRQTVNSELQTPNVELPLIVNHEIVSLPSASTLAVLREEVRGRNQNAKYVAVLADPVFEASDLRVKKESATIPETNKDLSRDRTLQSLLRTINSESALESAQPIPRLPYTRREALSIAALVNETQSKVFLDFDANYANATNTSLGQYRFLHFATHGLLNAEQPELSGILLSLVDQQGQPQSQALLRLGEVYNLKLPVELVVLSGCQTALGKEIKGEGLIGLTRGFMYAGSPRVVASVWKVDDAMTAEIMKYFYEAMLGPKRLPPAAALRHAQKQMLQQKIEPFYWAAFVIQGEWR
jgi:CHAT domain-containing protein/Tfp pilus assembly protein PilF